MSDFVYVGIFIGYFFHVLYNLFLIKFLGYKFEKYQDKPEETLVGTTLYLAKYNDMVLESDYKVLSIHLTYEGAKEAIRTHFKDLEAKHIEAQEKFGVSKSFEELCQYKDWKVESIKIEL